MELVYYDVSDQYDTYDEPLYGVWHPEYRCRYKSIRRPTKSVESREHRDLITDFTGTVPTEFDRTGTDVDDAVRDQLEDLGYA